MQTSSSLPHNSQLTEQPVPDPLVDCDAIGYQFSMSGRHVLKLAARGQIPCYRFGRKCVRFSREEVAKAFETMHHDITVSQ